MKQAELHTTALFADFYALTMMQAYYLNGVHENPVVFDMFFRRQPFHGGFSIFAGLDEVLKQLEVLSFSDDDLAYLEGLGLFHQTFLDYLRSFSFRGSVYAMPEGNICFPYESLLSVHGGIAEVQLIEGLILNTINYQTLVATKTARIYHASGQGDVMEFGLRRAHGRNGALSASRAAYIGGAMASSNTAAGKHYGIPIRGTMAHSWVMASASEEEAFTRYAELYPNSSSFLLDTYNTLTSGLQNAIKVGKKLQKQGQSFSVRLDSGDIEYLSKQVRAALDAEGLDDARIIVSNELNEYIIQQLVASNCPVDVWGVGSAMVCAPQDAMFSGVYKLVAKETNGKMQPTMKQSDDPLKASMPGIKQVYRLYSHDGMAMADFVTLSDEEVREGESYVLYHPSGDRRHFRIKNIAKAVPLLSPVMVDGKTLEPRQSLPEMRRTMQQSMQVLDPTHKRILNPHIYKVAISEQLRKQKLTLMDVE